LIYQNFNKQIADLTKLTDLLIVLRSRVRLQNLLLYNSRSFSPFKEPEDALPCSEDSQPILVLSQMNPIHAVNLFV